MLPSVQSRPIYPSSQCHAVTRYRPCQTRGSRRKAPPRRACRQRHVTMKWGSRDNGKVKLPRQCHSIRCPERASIICTSTRGKAAIVDGGIAYLGCCCCNARSSQRHPRIGGRPSFDPQIPISRISGSVCSQPRSLLRRSFRFLAGLVPKRANSRELLRPTLRRRSPPLQVLVLRNLRHPSQRHPSLIRQRLYHRKRPCQPRPPRTAVFRPTRDNS